MPVVPTTEQVWHRQNLTSTWDQANDVALDDDGNAVVVGYSGPDPFDLNDNTTPAMLVLKVDPGGRILWERRYTEVDSFGRVVGIEAEGVVIDDEGSLFVSGTETAGTGIFVTKLDNLGNQLWLVNDFPGYYVASDVAVDDLGNTFVVGTAKPLEGSTLSRSDAFVMRLNSTGSVVWKRQFGEGDMSGARDVVRDVAGNVLVTGWFDADLPGGFGGKAAVVKYSPEGNEIWRARVGIGSESSSVGNGISTNVFGDIFVGGQSTAPSKAESAAFVLKLNSAGQEQWSTLLRDSTTTSGRGLAVAVHSDGSTAVAGQANRDGFVARLDPTGELVWRNRIELTTVLAATGVAFDDELNVVAVGSFPPKSTVFEEHLSNVFISKFAP